MPRYFLGVDGGQSSTIAVIGNEAAEILGRGTGGPCNHVTGAEAAEKFRWAMNASVDEACRNAQLDANTIVFAAACLGFSGGGDDKKTYTRALVRSEKYKITHDAEIALAGAHAGAPGIIVIAGTGSMAYGRNARGQTARAGGWGYVFGDEGGAFDLVRRAVRAILAAEEGWGPETSLTRMLLNVTGFPTANQLMHGFYTKEWHRARVAQLAPLVTESAESGDATAAQIVEDGADKLAWYVQGVHGKLFQAELVPVAPIGGVFQSACLRTAFEHRVLRRTGCLVVEPEFNPAEGALLEAMRLAT